MAKNIIVLTRGDTFDFDITIYDELYGSYFNTAQDGDIIQFRLMFPNQPYEEAILKKEFIIKDNPYGRGTFVINHTDTINLTPGVYYYAVKLIRPGQNTDSGEDEVVTVIDKTKFIIND